MTEKKSWGYVAYIAFEIFGGSFKTVTLILKVQPSPCKIMYSSGCFQEISREGMYSVFSSFSLVFSVQKAKRVVWNFLCIPYLLMRLSSFPTKNCKILYSIAERVRKFLDCAPARLINILSLVFGSKGSPLSKSNTWLINHKPHMAVNIKLNIFLYILLF